jgi:transposase
MSGSRTRRRLRARRPDAAQKPRGTFHPRARKVGPEHFGVVSIDCAKARSRWMLADFFGAILVPPTVVEHNRVALAAAVGRLRQALHDHDPRDLLVAVERAGRRRHAVRRAFAAAGSETRIAHPFAASRLRQPGDPGDKTDDAGLAAARRAAVNGFALVEHGPDEEWTTFQLLIRHRRDLVRKAAALRARVRRAPRRRLPRLRRLLRRPLEEGLCFTPRPTRRRRRRPARRRPRRLVPTPRRLRRPLPTPHPRPRPRMGRPRRAPGLGAAARRRFARALDDDRVQKAREIRAVERDAAAAPARTPYVLLLSFPGVNVVSAADFAAEMGPIEHHADARALTGRAGLRPSRHQSDQVDKASGPLARCCNRELRAAALRVADNLLKCNRHFNALAQTWPAQGKDARHTRVKAASRFCRIAYQIVAGRQVFRRPGWQGRRYVLAKLMAFHREHGAGATQQLQDLQAAVAQPPRPEHAAEAAPHEELERLQGGRRRGPPLLGDVPPIGLARLGAGGVQSTASGERGLTEP